MGKRLTYAFVKEQIENEGYKLLSKEYVNALTKLEIQCTEDHVYEGTYANFQQGKRCSYCAGLKKHTYEYVKKNIEKVKGYKVVSTKYNNSKEKLELICPEDHTFYMRYNDFQQGHRCSYCSNNVSKGEKETLKYVKCLTDEQIIKNDRTQIVNPLTGYNLELDIWIPSLNKAIEYNGEHWHSDIEVKIRDQEKVKQCKEKGIDLLIIWEDNWQSCRMLCEKRIKQWLQ